MLSNSAIVGGRDGVPESTSKNVACSPAVAMSDAIWASSAEPEFCIASVANVRTNCTEAGRDGTSEACSAGTAVTVAAARVRAHKAIDRVPRSISNTVPSMAP